MRVYVTGMCRESKGTILEACLVSKIRKPQVFYKESSSGKNLQPEGLEETRQAALARARNVREEAGGGAYVLGVETGIVRIAGTGQIKQTMMFDMVAIISPGGQEVVISSGDIPVPEEYMLQAEKHGFDQVTVSTIIAKETGGSTEDPHKSLTGGRISRGSSLQQAIRSAFACLAAAEEE